MMPTNTMRKVLDRVSIDSNGCWIYTGSVGSHGYASVSWNSKRKLLHRLTYEQMFGPIPEGYQLDHLCRVPRCVNPLHLEAVSPGENTRRGAQGLDLTGYCKKGLHDTRLPNGLFFHANGNRSCRECRKETKRRYYQRLKQRQLEGTAP